MKGIKKAVGDYNSWIGHAKIMCDTKANEVWTDVFAGCQEWKEYHDKNIIILVSKVRLQDNWDKTTIKEVECSTKDPNIIYQHNLYC